MWLVYFVSGSVKSERLVTRVFKDGGKSLLRKAGKFRRVGAHLGMQRMFVEKLVFNVIITSRNHL